MTRVSRVFVHFLLIGVACGVGPPAALAQTTDPLEGHIVREIRITGLTHLSPDDIERHLVTRVGDPFRRTTLAADARRLDELRLFSAVSLEPRLVNDGVVLQVALAETLRLLPTVVIAVTDENGVSAGLGIRGINLLGRGMQTSLSFLAGGQTSISAKADKTTITPGTWTQHLEFSYSDRRNTLYEYDEQATTIDARFGRNWRHAVRTGLVGDILSIDTASSGLSLSPDGRDVIPTLGGFVTVDTLDSSTNPQSGTWAEVEVDRLLGDADSWTFVLDGRRYQHLSGRHGLGLFSLASFQTGELGVGLPVYLQFALGGANTVRGWSLGSRRGRDQFIGSVEYSYFAWPVRPFSVKGVNLYAGLQVVGFADVGVTSNDASTTTTPGSAIGGYGIGLHVLVPFVDMVRLELAGGEPGEGATAYFGISLKAVRQRQRVR